MLLTRRQLTNAARKGGRKALFRAVFAAYTDRMADLLVVVTIAVFFVLCVAFTKGCDIIIGPDDPEDLADASEELIPETVTP